MASGPCKSNYVSTRTYFEWTGIEMDSFSAFIVDSIIMGKLRETNNKSGNIHQMQSGTYTISKHFYDCK